MRLQYFRKLEEPEKSQVLKSITDKLQEYVSTGWSVSLAEKKTCQELGLSMSVVSEVSGCRKFREFYNKKRYP